MSVQKTAAIVIVLSAIAVASPFSTASEAVEMARLPASITSALEDIAADCDRYCRDCGENKHEIIEATTELNNAESHHLENCNPLSCEESGHLCGGLGLAFTIEQVTELWQFLSSAEGAAAALANSEKVNHNHARSAVQVMGCDGQIVLSVPAPSI